MTQPHITNDYVVRVDLKYMRRKSRNTGADDLDTASRRSLPGDREIWIGYDQRRN